MMSSKGGGCGKQSDLLKRAGNTKCTHDPRVVWAGHTPLHWRQLTKDTHARVGEEGTKNRWTGNDGKNKTNWRQCRTHFSTNFLWVVDRRRVYPLLVLRRVLEYATRSLWLLVHFRVHHMVQYQVIILWMENKTNTRTTPALNSWCWSKTKYKI